MAPTEQPVPPVRVLVVDDDEAMRAYLADGLATLGFGSETTSSAAHALELLRASDFDAVISEDGTRVCVFVEDNGHGIAGEHLTAIFTPFFTTKGEGRGTGLGLSIVKNILDNHNAEIRAERSSLGGARFVLVFPVTSSS